MHAEGILNPCSALEYFFIMKIFSSEQIATHLICYRLIKLVSREENYQLTQLRIYSRITKLISTFYNVCMYCMTMDGFCYCFGVLRNFLEVNWKVFWLNFWQFSDKFLGSGWITSSWSELRSKFRRTK